MHFDSTAFLTGTAVTFGEKREGGMSRCRLQEKSRQEEEEARSRLTAGIADHSGACDSHADSGRDSGFQLQLRLWVWVRLELML